MKFHDGTAFDAEVVKFNLDRARNDARSNLKADMELVEAVEVTGSHQVVIKLKRPNYSIPTIFAYRPGLMVSPTAIKNAQGGNIDRAPVGTGPFKFVSWQDNDRIVLTRNENYWQDRQALSRRAGAAHHHRTGDRAALGDRRRKRFRHQHRHSNEGDRRPRQKVSWSSWRHRCSSGAAI